MMSAPAARLTRQGAAISAGDADLAKLGASFERDHAVHLPGLFDPALVTFLRRQIEIDGFQTRVNNALPSAPTDLGLNPGPASALIMLVMNDAPFLEFVRRLTGHSEIQSVSGKIHRRIPGAGHDEDAWHNDLIDGRIVAFTIDLSAEPYRGGLLQIREAPDGPIVYEFANTTAGDAVLFKLDQGLKHRVTAPEGRPRTVCAGWFRDEPVRDLFQLSR
jgi:hypothetical protein